VFQPGGKTDSVSVLEAGHISKSFGAVPVLFSVKMNRRAMPGSSI